MEIFSAKQRRPISLRDESATADLRQPLSLSCPQLGRAFFNKIKHYRRVATRYDRLAANYLAFIQLASIKVWLRVNESAP
jgi:hypothetical protein